MTKDPAVLIYIDKWLLATKSMPADAKGWYLNLILTQYDRGGELPNDIEELALICDVRFSEFEKFKATWEQVLKQKFKQNERGYLYNEFCNEILKSRETFKEKRETAGSIGFVVKIARAEGYTEAQIENLKKWPEIQSLFKKDKQELKQVLKQIQKLFINVDVNVIEDEFLGKGVQGEKQITAEMLAKIPEKVHEFADRALMDISLLQSCQNKNSKITEHEYVKLVQEFRNVQIHATDYYHVYQQFKRHLLNSNLLKNWEPNKGNAKTKSGQALSRNLASEIRYDENGNAIL